MNIIKSFNQALEITNKFLTSNKKEVELRFQDGLFLKVIKHIKDNKQELEIHTSGYDGTLEVNEAIDWIKWELMDLKANRVIV